MADDVVDGQEIVGDVQLLDQVEFMGDELADFLRDAVRIAPVGAGPGQVAQVLDGGLVRRHRLVGVFVA